MAMPMRAYKALKAEEETVDDCIHPEVTPRLNVIVKHKNGNFSFPVFPDSGRAVTMIAKDLAVEKNMEIVCDAKMLKFAAVNGAKLQIDGTTLIEIENLDNGIRKTTVVIVSPDVSNDILLGYQQSTIKRITSHKTEFPIVRVS